MEKFLSKESSCKKADKQFKELILHLPDPIVPARGVANESLLVLSIILAPSPDWATDTCGVGGGGMANLSCSCLESVEAAGTIVGNSK